MLTFWLMQLSYIYAAWKRSTINVLWRLLLDLTEHINLLEKHFAIRIFVLDSEKKLGNGIDWPHYFPNLNLCDFFLFGHLKGIMQRAQTSILHDFKIAIERKVIVIEPDTLTIYFKAFNPDFVMSFVQKSFWKSFY